MDLVTVTCAHDLKSMLLQANSIDQFVKESCTHWVIIEDSNRSSVPWDQLLFPFYKNHNLKLINNFLPPDGTHSWRRQQLLKFMIARQLRCDSYLILDSKNFFIKPIDLTQWPIAEGSHDVAKITPGTLAWNWLSYLEEKYKLPKLNFHWSSFTPYRVKTDTVREILKLDMVEMFKNIADQWVSEFILYSQFVNPPDPRPGVKVAKICFNSKELPTDDDLDNIKNSVDTKMLSVHRSAIYGNINDPRDENKLKLLRDFLVSINLDQQLINDVLNLPN